VSKKSKRKTPFSVLAPHPSKRPFFGAQPDSRKLPVAAPTPSFNDQFPSWRVARLELVDPFGFHIVSGALLLEIREKLAHFEAKTWNEILIREKHRNHTVSVSEICNSARERLKAMNLDDIEEVVSLRLTGPQRVWGYRIEAVFHVLWWDPQHKVYGR